VFLLLLATAAVLGWRLATGAPSRVALPSLVNLTLAEARARASDLTLTTGTAVFSDIVANGRIVRQDPPAGTRLRHRATVTVSLSKGADMRRVPSMIGLSIAKSRAALATAHLVVARVDQENSDTIAKDLVIRQSRPAGSALHAGRGVVLVVSLGPAQATVPNVEGERLATAKALLERSGFRTTVGEEFSDAIRKGLVIRTDPVGGTIAHRTDTVTITVSKGPDTVVVPDVRGLTILEAASVLRSRGLRGAVQDIVNGTGKRVSDQSPLPGSVVKRGTLVNLYRH
jgi:serine/threonine-protein kinase